MLGEDLGIALQPRDHDLLCGLFESRVMTLGHIAVLYFNGKKEMAKKRVQRLKAAGLVRERPRHQTEPSILFLAKKALELLRNRGHLCGYPTIAISQLEKRTSVSALTLRHELEVMDVKTAMTAAVNKTERFRIAEFSTWPRLNQFKSCRPDGERVMVKPDGFIRIEEAEADGELSEHTFYLELDRSTEGPDVLADRCHCYLDYYRIGDFAVRNGGSRQQYKEFPFRVLVVCKTPERRDNVALRLLENSPPILTFAMLTTLTECVREPTGQIWVRPSDYRTDQAILPFHTFVRIVG
jgi:hypothetical protein